MPWNTAFRKHAHGPCSHTAWAQILESLRACVYPLTASMPSLQKKQSSKEASLLALFGKCHVQLCIRLRTMAGAYCPCTLACIVVTVPPLDRPLCARVNEINKVVAFLELRNAVEDGQIRKPQVKMLGHNYSGPEVWLFLELALWLLAGRPQTRSPCMAMSSFDRGEERACANAWWAMVRRATALGLVQSEHSEVGQGAVPRGSSTGPQIWLLDFEEFCEGLGT